MKNNIGFSRPSFGQCLRDSCGRLGDRLRFVLGVTLLAGGTAMMLHSTARASEEALYEPAAPPGSAFVRLFNASSAPDVDGSVGDKSFTDVAAYSGSSYAFVAPGSYTLQAGSASQSFTASPNGVYTAVYDGKSIQLIQSERFDNRLKAHVSLYNLIGAPSLSLKTADGKTTVVEGIAAGATGAREVNPVKIHLAVFSGDTRLADAAPVALERGKSFSLFVTGTLQDPVLEWVVN